MRHSVTYFLSFSLISIAAGSCVTHYRPQTVQYSSYRVNDSSVKNQTLMALLQPYADSVNRNMNDIIAVAANDLEKKQPEGSLGNMMADAMLLKAKEMYGPDVAGAFINNGGLRLTVLPKGNITRSKIFELAPFDNSIVLLKLSGSVLLQFLNHISNRGGWPTAGINWQIKNLPAGQAGKQAVNVTINGQPLYEAAVYNIAMIDYVANGGDDCNMLRAIPQQNKGYILRDAIIEYLSSFTKQGKTIAVQIENRVTNAE